jgi:DNA-binding NarL/FixJ family response regulator
MRRWWPLTGRAEELQFVTDSLYRQGRPAGVVLAGAAGVGKTRLAREALGLAALSGASTKWAVATSSARAVQLGALAPSLDLANVSMSGDPATLSQQAIAALLSGAPAAGVIIGIDDAHLLDDLSASVVHQLALQRLAPLVVTVRTGEPAPDAITALWKDDHLVRLELQTLTESETVELIEAALDGPLESHSGRRLWEMSGGNALYLNQMFDGALSSEALRCVAGVWQWRGTAAVTPRLAELVEQRLFRLPEPQRDVLDLLAIGEPLAVATLGRLANSMAVEESERRGLVVVEPSGRRLEARLAHPLYGEVSRSTMSVLRGRRIRGQLADAIGAGPARRSGDAVQRALLAMDSDLAADPVLLSLGARQALRRVDLALGERLARAALAAGGGFDAGLTLGHILSWSHQPAEAEAVLMPLGAVASTDDERVRAAVVRLANLFWSLGRSTEAEQILSKTLDEVEDPHHREELVAFGATLMSQRNNTAMAITDASAVMASESASGRAITWAALALSLSLSVVGRGDEVPEVVRRGHLAAAQLAETSALRVAQGMGEMMSLRLTGRLAAMDEATDRYDELVRTLNWDAFSASYFHGVAALACGKVRAAQRWLREAVAGFSLADPADWTFFSLLSLSCAEAMAGHSVSARQTLTAAEGRFRQSVAFLEPELYLARARVRSAEGATSEALNLARRAASLAADTGQLAVEVVALHTAVCLGDRTVASRLRWLAKQVDGPRAAAAAEHAAALADNNGDRLDEASVQIENFGALLEAADAAAQAAGAHQQQDSRSRALASAARAARLAAQCEGAWTYPLLVAATPLPLTEREREVATLARGGLSNRDIAARLGVSIRTVEGHIYRACLKVNVPNRAALAALLDPGR